LTINSTAIETEQTLNACLKVLWVDYHCPYLLVKWAVASDGSILMGKTASLVAAQSAIVARGVQVGQVLLASQDQLEVAECASPPYSAEAIVMFEADAQQHYVPETLRQATLDSLGMQHLAEKLEVQ
jgi:hypothetical protein